jgi:hypothetical protein
VGSRADQAGLVPHLAPLLRNASARGRLGHPDRPGALGSPGRPNHNDLHIRPESGSVGRIVHRLDDLGAVSVRIPEPSRRPYTVEPRSITSAACPPRR